MKNALRYAACPPLLLALAACGSDDKPAEDPGAASSTILEPSVSDAMLPYDTVRSQPPLAKPVETPKPGGTNGPAGEAPPVLPDGTPAEPEPAPPAQPATPDEE